MSNTNTSSSTLIEQKKYYASEIRIGIYNAQYYLDTVDKFGNQQTVFTSTNFSEVVEESKYVIIIN